MGGFRKKIKKMLSYVIIDIYYIMDNVIIFNRSAFKHGVSEASIRHALSYPRYEGPLEDDEDKYIVLGFDAAGNLLEILYNRMDDDKVNIFHAMKCRNIYYPLLNI